MAKLVKSPIPDNIFEKAIAGAKELLGVFKQIVTELKEAGAQARKTLTDLDFSKAKNVTKLSEQIRKLEDQVRGLEKVKKEEAVAEKELNRLRKENVTLTAKEAKSTSTLAKSNAELKVKLQEQNKVAKQAARERLGLVSLYEKEAKRLVELRKRYKDVALAEGETSKKAIELRNAAQKLDARLKRLDSNVGQFQRNVGNYRRAWASVGRILTSAGILGGAAGVIAAFKDITKTIIGFEKSLSTLSSITGATGADLEFYKNEAIAVGAATTKTSSQVLDAFKEIGSARPELLKNKEALAAVTKEAIILSEAAGLEVPQAAKALAAGLNQFQLPAEDSARIINTLAAGSKLGSVAIPEITEGLNKFGGIARVANIPIEASVALIEAIGPAGLVGAEGGTKIRNVLISLAKGADDTNPKIVGLETALENLAEKELTTAELAKQFGKQNLLAAQTLIEQRKKVKDLTKELTGTNIAYEQAAINTNNLDGNIKRLDSAWEGLILTIDSGEGAISGFISAIVVGITKLLNLLSGVEKSFQDVNQEIFNNAEASSKAAIQSQKLLEEYESLVADGLEPSADETKRLEEITLLLKDALGESVVAIDEETGALLLNTDAVREQIKIKRFAADQEAATLASRLKGEQEAIKLAELREKSAIQQLEVRKRIAEDLNVLNINEALLITSGKKLTEEQTEGIEKLRAARKGLTAVQDELIDRRRNEVDLLEKLKALNFDLKDIDLLFKEQSQETIVAADEVEERVSVNRDKRSKKRIEGMVKELELLALLGSTEDSFTRANLEAFEKEVKARQDIENILLEAQKKLQEALTRQQREADANRIAQAKKTAEEVLAAISFADNALTAAAENRQEDLDKQISDAQRRQEEIQSAIEAGSEGARESLTQARREEEEAAQAREKSIERQKQLEATLTMLKLISSYAGSGVTNPVGKATRDIISASAFADAFFYEGTERVDQDKQIKKVHSGRDGYRAGLSGDERVMTGKQNSKVGNLSNDILANVGYLYRTGKLVHADSSGGEALSLEELKGINKTLRGLPGKMPVANLDKEMVTGIVTTVLKRGNNRTRTRETWASKA